MLCLVVAQVGCGGGDIEHPFVPNFSSAPSAALSDAPVRPQAIPKEERDVDVEGAKFLIDHWSMPEGKIDVVAPPELTQRALLDSALLEARGLDLVDRVHVAELKEGERVHLTVPAGPALCLTVVAHGGLGVMEADAFVVAHDSSPPEVLAQDTEHGPKSVVGGMVGCYVADEHRSTVDVVVQARRGSGPIVFAIYEGKNGTKH